MMLNSEYMAVVGLEDAQKLPNNLPNPLGCPTWYSVDVMLMVPDLVMCTFPGEEILKEAKN